MAVRAVAAVPEDVHQRAGEEQEVGKRAKDMPRMRHQHVDAQRSNRERKRPAEGRANEPAALVARGTGNTLVHDRLLCGCLRSGREGRPEVSVVDIGSSQGLERHTIAWSRLLTIEVNQGRKPRKAQTAVCFEEVSV